MTRMKYVMNTKKIPSHFVLIPDNGLAHSCVEGDWTSAGFVSIGYDVSTYRFMCDCYGESVSLKLKSDPKDSTIIEDYMNQEM